MTRHIAFTWYLRPHTHTHWANSQTFATVDVGVNADFYVKIFLLRNGRRTEKKQSRVVRTCTTTNTVVFNEAFYFDLPPSPIHRHHSRRATPTDTPHRRPQAHLADTSAEILLLDWNRSSKEDVVGSLQIGPFGRPSSLAPAAAAAVASSGGEGSMAAGGGSASVTSDGRDRLALWPSPQIAQNEVTTAMLLNAVDRDRQVAVWYKLSDWILAWNATKNEDNPRALDVCVPSQWRVLSNDDSVPWLTFYWENYILARKRDPL